MKKLAIFFLYFFACAIINMAAAAEIWVSPSGNDANSGTSDKPLATIAKALRIARDMRRLSNPVIAGGINIIVKGGLYPLHEPLYIRHEDSGTPESPTNIEAAPNEQPILSGGVAITGWQKVKGNIARLPKEAQGKIYVANAPKIAGRVQDFRQLWVNDTKAIRARDRDGDSMNRILSWNRATEECWIPTPAVASLANAEGLEFLIHQWWEIAILRVRNIEVRGDSAKLSFYQPESRIQSEHPWPKPWISKETGNSAFFFSNAIQLLNQPGEWYLDIRSEKIYFWPRAGEDMATASVIAPVLETLVKMEGTIDYPMSNVSFRGISFAHTGWLRPSTDGHVPHQTGMYMLEAYSLKMPGTPDKKTLENQAWVGRPKAAVHVSYAYHTAFENCQFIHHASCGLDYEIGTHDNLINGNLFKDIGGNGMQIGMFSDENTEAHFPYNPTDKRVICSNEKITNNLVTDATNEDWGCVGIAAGYVKGIRILHNEIYDVSYSGISMGWGWTKTINAMSDNQIVGNKITHYAKRMYDVAAIYTLSAQPGSVISHNYIDSIYKAPYAHIADHWFYLYCDEGSAFFTVKDNWCPAKKFLRNANGPNNIWENNGPEVADSIKYSAGVGSQYKSLIKNISPVNNWPINRISKKAIELVGNNINVKTLEDFYARKDWIGQVYQWNNHYVFYGYGAEPEILVTNLTKAFAGAEVKMYHQPLYEFTRDHCGDKTTASQWDDILLTANLVSDTAMQRQYIAYHASQFTKWPEVAKGFCNANFQQLQVFKQGRQLMLVISIPKGASLDELNPKTTENNPRVGEWNALMKTYQEGIPGTEKDEVWVFLKPARKE